MSTEIKWVANLFNEYHIFDTFEEAKQYALGLFEEESQMNTTIWFGNAYDNLKQLTEPEHGCDYGSWGSTFHGGNYSYKFFKAEYHTYQ